MQRFFEKNYIMDENDSLSEYNDNDNEMILLRHKNIKIML